jgi:hypothetical protein
MSGLLAKGLQASSPAAVSTYQSLSLWETTSLKVQIQCGSGLWTSFLTLALVWDEKQWSEALMPPTMDRILRRRLEAAGVEVREDGHEGVLADVAAPPVRGQRAPAGAFLQQQPGGVRRTGRERRRS